MAPTLSSCRLGRLSLAALAAAFLAGAKLARAESFDSLSAKARLAQNQGRKEEALSDLSQALKLWDKADGKPQRAQALADKASLETDLGELDAAIADLAAATKTNRRNPEYFYRLGLLYLRQARNTKALGQFYKAVALDLNYKEAYFARGQAYSALGDKDFSRQDYKRACKLGLRAGCDALDVTAPLRRKRALVKAAFKRCQKILGDCAQKGASFSQCVQRVKACRPLAPQSDCCPAACLDRFWGLLQEKSEAQAYRAVFLASRPTCAGIP